MSKDTKVPFKPANSVDMELFIRYFSGEMYKSPVSISNPPVTTTEIMRGNGCVYITLYHVILPCCIAAYRSTDKCRSDCSVDYGDDDTAIERLAQRVARDIMAEVKDREDILAAMKQINHKSITPGCCFTPIGFRIYELLMEELTDRLEEEYNSTDSSVLIYPADILRFAMRKYYEIGAPLCEGVKPEK